MPEESVKIGIVAGEASGDQLGGALLAELKKIFPEGLFEGVGGEKMQAQGFRSLFPMERLSVMGFVEPLKRLGELIRIRRSLYRHFLQNRFDLVIGIDSPDFNLGLELKLRKQGVNTAHYVSPSVWAWRQGRVKKIARAVDHMLTLFPFEAEFYRQHRVPVTCVGHPLADQIAGQPDTAGARRFLGLAEQGPLIALLPGSRRSEIDMMARLFLEAASVYQAKSPGSHFVMPAATGDIHTRLQGMLEEFPGLNLSLLQGESHRAMEASDLVILTSGTTALEAMLLKKPMIVGYRMGGITYRVLSRLVKTPFIALPNLLAGRELVPELIQDAATVEQIVGQADALLGDKERTGVLLEEFARLHGSLRCNAAVTAAATLAGLIGRQ